MSTDANTDAPSDEPNDIGSSTSGGDNAATSLEEQVAALTAQLADSKSESRKWEGRAKENQRAARQIEEQRQASMSESERAVAEAEQRGRTAAASDFGKRLARSAFEAAATRRNPDYDSSALDFVDLSRFVGDDGEPDVKEIAKAVERLVPTPVAAPPSFDGGARSSAPKAPDMNQAMRQALGRT